MSNTLDWTVLFEEEAPRLMRFLRRFGPRVSAEDVRQEAFAKLVAAKEDIASPRAYLTTTARNLALNDLRRQKNAATDAHADIETIAPAYTADPETLLIAAEAAAAQTAALDALDPALREALLLHLVEGMTQAEVAARLGCSRRTVQRHITAALEQLHLALADPDL
jgi:RNA polymerase sigma-70 factor (ECF subfamily)